MIKYKTQLNRDGLKKVAFAWLQEDSAQMGETFDLSDWDEIEQASPEYIEELLIYAELAILAYRKHEELEAQDASKPTDEEIEYVARAMFKGYYPPGYSGIDTYDKSPEAHRLTLRKMAKEALEEVYAVWEVK